MQAVPEFAEVGEGARERGGEPLDVVLRDCQHLPGRL